MAWVGRSDPLQLRPRPGRHHILIINNQQFGWSLQGLGFNVNAGIGGDRFQQEYMTTFDGYLEVSRVLSSVGRCELKTIFPYKPILCRW
jgi:hypothetical protein